MSKGLMLKLAGHLSDLVLSQAGDHLTCVLNAQEVLLMGAEPRPPHPGCRQLLSFSHVCRLSDLDPEDSTVHSCVLPNPEGVSVCHTLNPLSFVLFQVEVLFF